MQNVNCTHVLLFLLVFEWTVFDSRAYKTYTFDDVSLCEPSKKSKLDIGKSAILVNYTSDSFWNGFYDFTCTFKVRKSLWIGFGTELFSSFNKHGVIAVLQRMNLRRDRTTGECIDYVRFHSNGNYKTQKLCGEAKITSTDPFALSTTYHEPLVFVNTSVDVTVFISKKKIEPPERLELLIAFTGYKVCSLPNLRYMPCNDLSNDLCISTIYFKDGVVNCPYYNCTDEFGCPVEKKPEAEAFGISSLLSTLGSLTGAFVLLIACIVTCRQCIRYVRSRLTDDRPTAVPPTASSIQEPAPSIPDPSAPALLYEEEEDKPPSYSSLFPGDIR